MGSEPPKTVYLSVKVVAERLGVSEDLVYGWLKNHDLKGVLLPGRARGIWRVTEADLQEFLERKRNA